MDFRNAVSPFEEAVSYETLWEAKKGSLKDVAKIFEEIPATPSEALQAVRDDLAVDVDQIKNDVRIMLSAFRRAFSVCIRGVFQYPERLQAAKYPVALFYYKGDIGLSESTCVSIVGARKCSEEGKKRAAKLARGLVEKKYTIVSGLAAGIDTAAMTAAKEAGGHTIGVIGTTINQAYPKENKPLQEEVAEQHLLISHVPFYWYSHEPFQFKRRYFPERNAMMSALSQATVIVEASEGSGTLTQARACLQQGRKLFILNSCFENPNINWPKNYEKRGAIRVRDFDDIFEHLGAANGHGNALEEN